jgi:hypothetical protein
MALLFMDSFDHYITADLTEKWTSLAGTVAIQAAAGRRGSAAARITASTGNYLAKGLAVTGATGVIGFALKLSAIGNVHLAGFHDGGTNKDQVYVQVNADGSLAVYRGYGTITGINSATAGTLLGTTAAGLIAVGVTAYIEFKALIHATAGTALVRVNGAPVLTLSSLNTSTGTVVWTTAFVGWATAGGSTADFDDLYVLDGSGVAPWNDCLGDCRVDACFPTAAGATTGWTPSAGANWQCVDDAAPNDDTDYTSAAAAPLTDTFVVADAPVAGATIYGVQHCLSVKKLDAGAATIAPVIRHAGVDYPGADLSPGTAYAFALQVAAVNPGTSAQWTAAHFNSAEFGYRKTL